MIAASAAGATDVTVRVTDPHQGAIPAATMYLIGRDGERQTRATDSSGSCRFRDVAPGKYFVQGEAAGFDASPPRPIELTSEATVDVALSLGVAQVRSSVVVTASGTLQTTDEV